MHIFQKHFLSFIIPAATFVALHLLPLTVECSYLDQNQYFTTDYKFYNKHNANKVRRPDQRTFDIELHGILLWAAMGFFMPLGILSIRMFNKDDGSSRKKLRVIFYLHAILQSLAVLLSTAGAVLSFKSFENSFSNAHQRIGLALYGAVWMQAMLGLRRPKRGTNGRRLWYIFHWIFGTTLFVVGIFNIYTGLKAYHKRTSRSISLWSTLFIADVSFIAFCYLFQDKWGYIQRQGEPVTTILDHNNDHQLIAASHDQILPLGDVQNQKEELPVQQHEPRRKSNSLGNYFAKSNPLKKLFQLT